MSTGPLPRLLVAGVGPLPPERPDRLFAPGLRIWGMARELARAGHPVRLICAQFGESRQGQARRYDLLWERRDAPLLPQPVELDLPDGGWPQLLAGEAESFAAAAAIGSTDVMNHALAGSGLKIPIWMDFFGDPMAERQMLALRHGSDAGLADQWNLVAPALARADRLSGCSADQCAAILGQLGAVGRLGRHTVRDRLIHRLAPWIEPIPIDIDCDALVRGAQAPADAFIIVQTGGFNTWLDVHTLFAALELAMAANPRIHFACTGGAIPGHHAGGYQWFAAQAVKSAFKDRFHPLGWVPLGQVPRLISEGDLGLNVDLDCPEGVLGTRNRLLDWILGGLAVVSTPGCELAQELGDEGFITLAPHGDAEALSRAILAEAARDPKERRAAGEAAATWLRRVHDPRACLAPLLDWAAAPKPASDLQVWKAGSDEPPSLLVQMVDAAGAVREARQQAKKLAWLERRLARLEGSRLVRWALRVRGRRDFEADPPPEEL